MRTRLGQIENLEQRINLSGLGSKLPDIALLELQTKTHMQYLSELENFKPVSLTDPTTPSAGAEAGPPVDTQVLKRVRPDRHLEVVTTPGNNGQSDGSSGGDGGTQGQTTGQDSNTQNPTPAGSNDNSNNPAPPQVQTPGSQQQQFQVAGLNEVDSLGRDIGFSVANVELQGTDGSIIDLTPKKTSETVIDSAHILQIWETDNGEVEIDAQLTQNGGDSLMNVQVTAGDGWTVKSIDMGAPWIFAPVSSDLKTYSAFKGGGVEDWSSTGWQQQNSSIWPDMGYSPLAVYYNQQTTEGVGFVSFDSGIKAREVYWYTGPGEVHPFVRWFADIGGGQSASTTMALHHDFGMPTTGFQYYRDNFLVPFMNSQGVQEGTFNQTGIIGTSGWPDGNDVSNSVNWSMSYGATGYLQYAPPDGSAYFEPNPETLSWYPTLKAASQISGNNSLGVLIDPFKASHYTSPTDDPSSPQWFPGGWGDVSLTDPNVQNFLTRLRTDLANQGVNFAFWDSGEAPVAGQEMQWFNVMKDFKSSGISVAVESSCDLTSYVSGTLLIDQLQDSDYGLLKTVTPDAKPLVLDWSNTPDASGQYWWDRASSLGFIPVLTQIQLPLYGVEHGFPGPT